MAMPRAKGVAALLAFVLAVTACSSGSTPSPSSGSSGAAASGAGASGAGGSGSPAASGSGGASGGTAISASGELNVMGFDCTKGDDIALNRIKEFKSKFPDVTLKCTEGGLNDQQFLTAVRSGSPPDLIYMDRGKIGTFASQGAIQPMDDCVSKAGIDMSNFRDAAVKQVTFDSKVYGIPEFFNVVVLVINNKVLKEAGVSPDDVDTSKWDALKAANLKLLKKSGNKITRLGFDPKLPEFLPLWAKINGVDLISADGKTSNLDDPKVAEALTFARDLIQAHGKAADFFAARDSLSADFFGAGNPIAKDVLGAFPIEQFFLNVMADTSPNVDITVKAPKTKDGQDISYATGLTWAVPEGAKNKDAACAMAATMTSKDTWVAASKARADKRKADKKPYTGTFTGNKAADAEIFGTLVDLSAMPQFDAAVKATVAVSDKAFAMPAVAGGADFEKAWRDAVNKVLNEGADPAQALKDADATAQQALDAGGG
ncbi:MAG TPA: extracellular solute-binding protein [Candidatus Limnocylindrales bacterium]